MLMQSLQWRIKARFGGSRSFAIVRNLTWKVTYAATILLRRTLGHRQRIVIVVGSMGKTTPVRALMKSFGEDPNTVRNNHHFGVAWAFVRNVRRLRVIPIEVGIDGPRQMWPYARMLRPDFVVVTSVGVEHIRAFKTLENTRQEKPERKH
jgi:UDP-N-acetylmuramyl pentapeptide synthase